MKRHAYEHSLYDRLKGARETLGLGEEVTMDEIRKNFHDLIRRWHPDKTQGNDDLHKNKSAAIIQAYKTIMDYCRDYRISFSRETVSRYRSEDEFWWERFGNDPMWGSGA
jgi:preprotein translocase subunit Sec63